MQITNSSQASSYKNGILSTLFLSPLLFNPRPQIFSLSTAHSTCLMLNYFNSLLMILTLAAISPPFVSFIKIKSYLSLSSSTGNSKPLMVLNFHRKSTNHLALNPRPVAILPSTKTHHKPIMSLLKAVFSWSFSFSTHI